MIDIEHLCFGYIKQPLLLVDINHKQNAKNLLVFGQSGSGKTSFLELLCGMQDLYAGKIQVLGKTPKDAYMDITYLPSNAVVLKNKTVRENLIFACEQVGKQLDENLFDQFFIDNMNTKMRKLSPFQQLWFCYQRAKIKDAKLMIIDVDLSKFSDEEVVEYKKILNDILADPNKNVVFAINDEDYKKLQICTKNSEICYLFATKSYFFENFNQFSKDVKFLGMAKYLDKNCIDASVEFSQNGYYLVLKNRKIKIQDKFVTEIVPYFDEVTTQTKVVVFADTDIEKLSDKEFNECIDSGEVLLFDSLTTSRLN